MSEDKVNSVLYYVLADIGEHECEHESIADGLDLANAIAIRDKWEDDGFVAYVVADV